MRRHAACRVSTDIDRGHAPKTQKEELLRRQDGSRNGPRTRWLAQTVTPRAGQKVEAGEIQAHTGQTAGRSIIRGLILLPGWDFGLRAGSDPVARSRKLAVERQSRRPARGTPLIMAAGNSASRWFGTRVPFHRAHRGDSATVSPRGSRSQPASDFPRPGPRSPLSRYH